MFRVVTVPIKGLMRNISLHSTKETIKHDMHWYMNFLLESINSSTETQMLDNVMHFYVAFNNEEAYETHMYSLSKIYVNNMLWYLVNSMRTTIHKSMFYVDHISTGEFDKDDRDVYIHINSIEITNITATREAITVALDTTNIVLNALEVVDTSDIDIFNDHDELIMTAVLEVLMKAVIIGDICAVTELLKNIQVHESDIKTISALKTFFNEITVCATGTLVP